MKGFRASLIIKISLFLVIVSAAILLSCIDAKTDSKKRGNIKSIKNINELKDTVKSAGNKLVVLDLYADWCQPCKLLTPMLAELSEEFKDKAYFYKINIDKNPDIAQIFNVTGIPLVILIKNRTASHALQGLASKSEYRRNISRLIDDSTTLKESAPDGQIVKGIRVIQLSTDSPPGNIYVYRGEKVKLIIEKIKYPYSIHIPEYKISRQGIMGKRLEVTFKAKNIGVFPIFCNGKCPIGDGAQYGRIIVMQYKSKEQGKYVEVNAQTAKEIIKKKKPLLLDVRTPNEFYSGHLKNAKLIPLQQLEQRISEISDYKNKDIFVYCRSGNRSTVAAEILIKHGFKKIYNLRTGIREWINSGNKVVE